jgi:hypothetical protein
MSYVTESYIEEMEYQELWDYANMITEGYLEKDLSDDDRHTIFNPRTDRINAFNPRTDRINVFNPSDRNTVFNPSKNTSSKSISSANNSPSKSTSSGNNSTIKSTDSVSTKGSSTSIENIKRVMSDTANTIWGFIQKNATVLSVSAVVVLVSVLAYKLYKKNQDGNCAGLDGKDYNNCKISSINKSIQVIKQSYNNCSKSKDPNACRSKLKQLIEKWEEKKKKYQNV